MHTFALALRYKADIKNGALVQLVRIHACHAWGHGFESRTHRKKPFSSLRGFFVCASLTKAFLIIIFALLKILKQRVYKTYIIALFPTFTE